MNKAERIRSSRLLNKLNGIMLCDLMIVDLMKKILTFAMTF